jgi:apolipoprotein D and lipocalin family protein
MLLCSAIAMFAGVGLIRGAEGPPEVVPDVDLTRYTGLWYEVARLPNWFQKSCTGETSAKYTLLDNGEIEVVNRCRKANGEFSEAVGKAKLANAKGSKAKLKVRFAPAILSLFPFVWGDYWILALAPDYSYALVGDPAWKYLWVLSRTPVMDEAIFQSVLNQAKDQGYDLTGLIRTVQTAK